MASEIVARRRRKRTYGVKALVRLAERWHDSDRMMELVDALQCAVIFKKFEWTTIARCADAVTRPVTVERAEQMLRQEVNRRLR